MRDRVNGINTFQGRVVYDRKKRPIKCSDVFRFARAAELPDDFRQLEKLIYTIITLLGILYSVDSNLIAKEKSKLYRLIVQIKNYSEDIRAIWASINTFWSGGLFGGGGASGDF